MTDPTMTWIKTHERLIVIVISLAVVVYIGRHWLDEHYTLASQEVITTASTLANQKETNKQLQQQFEDLKKSILQQNDQLAQQNAQLTSQSQAAYQQALRQQAADTRLSNQQLADRIAELASQKNIQSTDQGVQLNHDQSVGVTQKLEDLPSLQAQLDAEQTININNTKQIAGLNDELNQCTTLNSGLKTQMADQKKADDAQLKKAKLSGIKGRFKWFAIGFVSGFITGHMY